MSKEEIDLRPWEHPLGDPRQRNRDIEAAPYSRQEQRVAQYLAEIAFGGGDDPVGFLMASHTLLAHELKMARERIDKLIVNLEGGEGDSLIEWLAP